MLSRFEHGTLLYTADHGSHRQLDLASEAVGWDMEPEDIMYLGSHRAVSQDTIMNVQDWIAWYSRPQP